MDMIVEWGEEKMAEMDGSRVVSGRRQEEEEERKTASEEDRRL